MTNHDEHNQTAEDIFQQRHNNHTITNISVRRLRNRFIITALVNDRKIREVILLQEILEHNNDANNSTSDEDSSLGQYDPAEFATCIACEDIGQIGNLCTNSQCEDSGAIYADPLIE